MQYRYSMVSVHTIEKVGLKIRFLKKPIQFFSHRISGFTALLALIARVTDDSKPFIIENDLNESHHYCNAPDVYFAHNGAIFHLGPHISTFFGKRENPSTIIMIKFETFTLITSRG